MSNLFLWTWSNQITTKSNNHPSKYASAVYMYKGASSSYMFSKSCCKRCSWVFFSLLLYWELSILLCRFIHQYISALTVKIHEWELWREKRLRFHGRQLKLTRMLIPVCILQLTSKLQVPIILKHIHTSKLTMSPYHTVSAPCESNTPL
jgi:hypothetical protein